MLSGPVNLILTASAKCSKKTLRKLGSCQLRAWLARGCQLYSEIRRYMSKLTRHLFVSLSRKQLMLSRQSCYGQAYSSAGASSIESKKMSDLVKNLTNQMKRTNFSQHNRAQSPTTSWRSRLLAVSIPKNSWKLRSRRYRSTICLTILTSLYTSPIVVLNRSSGKFYVVLTSTTKIYCTRQTWTWFSWQHLSVNLKRKLTSAHPKKTDG